MFLVTKSSEETFFFFVLIYFQTYIKGNGTVYSVGDNTYGQLGLGTVGGNATQLTPIPGINNAKTVSCNPYSVLLQTSKSN